MRKKHRCQAGATLALIKLLRHHRHRCGDADGLDVRSHHLDRAVPGASVVAQERDCGLQHAQRRAFWRRAAGCRAAQLTLAGALAGWPAARPCGSRRSDLYHQRALAGKPP
jgi:hypothetical protein